MESIRTPGKPARIEMAAALLLYAATVVGSIAFTAHRPATELSRLGAGGVTALGTVAMALLLQRRTPYPRWSFLGSALVLAFSALAGTWLAGNQADLKDGAGSVLWMHPWFPMMMAWTSGPRSGVCAPSSPWAGSLLLGTAVVLGVITWGAVALGNLL